MFLREIKDGDFVIVDVDVEGSVVVLNGKNGSGDGFVVEEVMEDLIFVLQKGRGEFQRFYFFLFF